ncbi:MAG: GntR family transcriptional regulator [Clostridiales bacterium]|nr:GntR family transcriptional regulator [Candidatus Blautia equi]
MHIILNNSSMTPIYEQLMDQIKSQILSGELAENESLPSVRALSGSLKISALTVKKAYDRLEEDGFVVTVHGKGTFVAATDRQLALEARKKAVEDEFSQVIEKAKAVGLTQEDIREIFEILIMEE